MFKVKYKNFTFCSAQIELNTVQWVAINFFADTCKLCSTETDGTNCKIYMFKYLMECFNDKSLTLLSLPYMVHGPVHTMFVTDLFLSWSILSVNSMEVFSIAIYWMEVFNNYLETKLE